MSTSVEEEFNAPEEPWYSEVDEPKTPEVIDPNLWPLTGVNVPEPDDDNDRSFDDRTYDDKDYDQFGDRIYRYEIAAPEMSSEEVFYGEDFYYYCAEEEEVKEEEGERGESFSRRQSRRMSRRMSRRISRRISRRMSSFASPRKGKDKKRLETRTKYLFVHSSPINFPDLIKAAKSTFGPTFLRSTGDYVDDVALMRTLTDSSFSTLQSFLNSFDRILSAPFGDQNRKHLTTLYKESMLKNLEQHGITRVTSEGGVHWNLYPTTQNYLFSIHIGDHIHQTRVLSRIEDRILSGHVQRLRLPYAWPTESVWTGHWDLLGMAGSGTFAMPHGVTYQGKMQDGLFHDTNATLTYPNQFKAINCVYEKGKLMSCQFQFPDGLIYSSTNPEDWDYCRFPDRRFWSEVQNGLKPAKISQKTEVDPPRRIAPGCYDTNDGFYDPETLMLVSPFGELLRVPTCEEANWIKHYCRKGFFEPADFRPDLFENWFNFDKDLIQLVLQQQANFRRGKISYNELQQFYADFNLLPSWSTFKKRKFSREIELENFVKSIPSPKALGKFVKKFKGHKLQVTSGSSNRSSHSGHLEKFRPAEAKESKSLLKYGEDSNHKMSPKLSRISFKLTPDGQDSREGSHTRLKSGQKKIIPEKYLQYRPLLSAPFEKKEEFSAPTPTPRRPCTPSTSDVSRTGYSHSHMSDWDKDHIHVFAKSLIWGVVNDILLMERERHRKRLRWAQNQPLRTNEYKRIKPVIDDKCLGILEEMFDSIPDKEEFCDSDPSKTCDLKKLAQDRYRVLQYWGTRMFTLNFGK